MVLDEEDGEGEASPPGQTERSRIRRRHESQGGSKSTRRGKGVKDGEVGVVEE